MAKPKPPQSSPEGHPDTWQALIWKILSSPSALSTVLILVLIVYVLARASGYDLLASMGAKPLASTPTLAGVATDPKTAECIEKAMELKRPYVVLSINEVAHLQFDDSKSSRTADFTVSYTLLLLRDIERTDRVFKEGFRTATRNGQFTHVFGSEFEELPGQGETYDVRFSGKKGEIRTVTTAGRYVHTLPYPERRILREQLQLGPKEDTWNYPNEEDVIREITMLIISDRPSLDGTTKTAAKRLDSDGKLLADTATASGGNSDSPFKTLSARWEQVMPNEEVAIHFKW